MQPEDARRFATTLLRHRVGPELLGGPEHEAAQNHAVKIAGAKDNADKSDAEMRELLTEALGPGIADIKAQVEERKKAELAEMQKTTLVRQDSGLSPEEHLEKYGDDAPLPKDHPDYVGVEEANVIPIDSPDSTPVEDGIDAEAPLPQFTRVDDGPVDEGAVELLATHGIGTYGDLRARAEEAIANGDEDSNTIDLVAEFGLSVETAHGLIGNIEQAGGNALGLSAPPLPEPDENKDPKGSEGDPNNAPTPAGPDQPDTPNPLAVSIDAIGLDARYVKAYQAAGIQTVGDLIKHRDANDGEVKITGVAEVGIRETADKINALLNGAGEPDKPDDGGKAEPE